jgi:CelD/BcsL family acetyltransferase involved in cellulose biosynthesis
MLEISCIEDRTRLSELASEWNPLLQRSRSDSIFMTWEFMDTWWDVYGERFSPLVLVARDRDRVCGVAPLMVSRGEGPVGSQLRCLEYCGQGTDVTPEHMDFFVQPGREDEITTAFCHHLLRDKRSRWDWLNLKFMLTSSPNFQSLLRAFKRAGIRLEVTEELPCPFVQTQDMTWPEFLARKSRNFRKHLRNMKRRLRRLGDVCLRLVGQHLDLDRAFDRLVELNRSRWGEAGESFRSTDYTRFHRQLCRRFLDRGWLLLSELHVGGTAVASQYDFCYGGKIWGNQGGWRPDWATLRVGNIMLGEIVALTMELGYREYDFLGGDDEYKRRWSTHSRRAVFLQGSNTNPRGMLHRLGCEGKRWLREHLSRRRIEQLKRVRDLWARP